MTIWTDLIVPFLYGFGAALLVELVIDLLGENLRFRIVFLERRISKWIRPYGVTLVVSLKPNSWIGGEIDKIRALLDEKLDDNGIEHFDTETKVSFQWIEKRASIPITCSLTTDAAGRNDGMEIVINYAATYQGFGDHFVNLLTTLSSLEKLLRSTFHEVSEFDVTLSFGGLKRSPGSTGIFSSHSVEAIITKKDDVEINFSGDTVVLYGKLNSDMKRLVQDIVAYYG